MEEVTVKQAIRAKEQLKIDIASLIKTYREKYHLDMQMWVNTTVRNPLMEESGVTNIDIDIKISI
jgi:hypothetical protein